MQILAHRGFWRSPGERNTPAAFRRAFEAGYGVETDLRDLDGSLVISHDVPVKGPHVTTAESFIALYRDYPQAGPLALNIKCDGLQNLVADLMDGIGHEDWYCFDMAIPDAVQYARAGLPFFTRLSDIEPEPLMLDDACGVWADGFRGDFDDFGRLRALLDAGTQVCLVSPELHKRPHDALWDALRASGLPAHPLFQLCTDLPDAAKEFFK